MVTTITGKSIRVRTGVREGVVRLPAATLVDGPAVFVVGDDGVARKRPVTTGAAADGAVEIAAGVAAGERVVLAGQSRLADGDRVKTVED